MARNVAVTVTMLLGLTAGVQAQDATLAELYGSGVHAYHAGDYKDAFNNLNQAIKQGSKDPRAYFFRGLAYSKLGRPDEAKKDFKKGAELELTKAGKLIRVSRALARVQGKVRLQIEKSRRTARFAARNVRVKKEKVRYGILNNSEKQGLLDKPAAKTKVVVPANVKSTASNPFKPKGPVQRGNGTAAGAGTATGAGGTSQNKAPPKKVADPQAFDPPNKVQPKKVANTTQGNAGKAPAKVAPKQATVTKPAGPKLKKGSVGKALFSLFRGTGKSIARQAVGDIPGVTQKKKDTSVGKKFDGDNNAANPFGDDIKKKK